MTARAKLLMLVSTALLVMAAAAAGDDLSGGEAAQREVGVLAGRAASDYLTLAEEVEINFGAGQGGGAQAAADSLSRIALRDVPEILGEIAGLRAAGSDPARASKVAGLQEEVLRRMRELSGSGTGGVAVDQLRRTAAALAEEGEKRIEAAKQFAANALGKPAESMSDTERAQTAQMSGEQARAASDMRALADAAARAASASGGSTEAASESEGRVAQALGSSDLEGAAGGLEAAARSSGEGRVAQSMAEDSAALSELRKFREALEGRVSPEALERRVAEMEEEQRRLADDAASADSEALGAAAAGQEALAKSAAAASSEAARESLGQHYLGAAAESMAEAADGLSESARSAGAAQAQSRNAAAEKQERAAEYLAAARKALSSADSASLPEDLRKSLEDLESAQSAADAVDGAMAGQESLKRRTKAAGSRPKDLNALAAEQEEAGKALSEAGARQGGPAMQAPGAGEAQDVAGQLQTAAAAMKGAAEALSTPSAGKAAAAQDRALAHLKEARKALGSRAQEAEERMSQLAQSLESSSGGAPLPPSLEELASEARASFAAGRPQPSPRREPASAKSPGGIGGMKGLTQGSYGSSGAAHSGDAWRLTLPQGTPEDIMQSASGTFPKGYEEPLRRYYETIARD